LPRFGVQLQIGTWQCRDPQRPVSPLRQGLQPRQHVRKAVGLGQIIITAGLQPFYRVPPAADCTQHQHRHNGVRRAQAAHKGQSVQRQSSIHD